MLWVLFELLMLVRSLFMKSLNVIVFDSVILIDMLVWVLLVKVLWLNMMLVRV